MMVSSGASSALAQPTRFQQFKNDCQATWPRIKEIAIEIFKGIVAIALFIMNPAVFTVGMIIGVVWDNQSDQTVDKIVNIFKKQPFFILAGLGVASILCLQVTSGASSFIYGAYIGSRLSLSSKDD